MAIIRKSTNNKYWRGCGEENPPILLGAMVEPIWKNVWIFFLENLGFPHSSVGKESARNAGDPGFDSWVRKICWRRDRLPTLIFLGFPGGSAGKESTCKVGDLGSIPGVRRSSREWKGYPLLYSDLENSMCVGPQSQTRLSDFHFTKDRATILSSKPTPEYIPGQNLIQKDICSPVFTAAVFITARARENPQCPLTDEWMNIRLWDSPGQNTGKEWCALLQEIFPDLVMEPASLKSPALTGRFFYH